jgi:hypothetical protein
MGDQSEKIAIAHVIADSPFLNCFQLVFFLSDLTEKAAKSSHIDETTSKCFLC